MRKAFTLVEVVIVIAVLAIMSAVIIPTVFNAYENGKQDIIDIYNGKQIQVIDVDTDKVIYQGVRDGWKSDGYTLVDIEYSDFIVMKVKRIEKGDTK